MALKGTTRIELTNVKTGEREVIEKDNLVTNAVASILDNPFAWQLKSAYSNSCFAGNILPLCPNLFGGILLYQNAIPEKPDQIYAQSDNPLVGYSSNNVNDKTDIMRGSMNQNESGELDTRDGYRFVFDFTTSQANGTVGAVGLTSKWGGIAGYGSTEWPNTQSPVVFYEQNLGISDPIFAYTLCTMVHYNEETGVAISVFTSGQNLLSVTKVKLNTQEWKLTNKLDLLDDTPFLETVNIETNTFAGTAVSGTILNQNFCDGGDGYIWGFEHANNRNGNISGKATINWIKIKVDDLTIEEGTWEIDAQLRNMGMRSNNPGVAMQTRYTDESCSVVLDGYLYCINYATTGIYKINLQNITDVVFIEHPSKNVPCYNTNGGSSYDYFISPSADLVVSGNRVCMWNGYINGDKIVENKHLYGDMPTNTGTLGDGWINNTDGRYPYRNSAGLCGVDIGPYSLHIEGGYTRNNGHATMRAWLLLNSPYLATINNLPTPVLKTADKTMKITYILREES